MLYGMEREFSELKGQILQSVDVSRDKITFITDQGKYELSHDQDCCEVVEVEDIKGDLIYLLDQEILLAEKVESNENPEDINKSYQDSFTWTFYKLSTNLGSVTIRWYGESNGYYSEEVDFYKIDSDGSYI